MSPYRVQLWASYAGHVSTQVGFDVVSAVFIAFWWEAVAADSYQKAVALLGSAGYASSVVFYLDMVVNEAQVMADYWARVVRLMDEHQELRLQSGQWLEDAMQHVQMGIDLRQQAASQVAICCDQYQLALLEHTQAFFAELQAKGL